MTNRATVPPYLRGTWMGGAAAHALTAVPWVLGGFLIPALPVLLVLGFWRVAGVLLLLLLPQYGLPRASAPWPAFAQLLKDLNPRKFFARCELRFDGGAVGAAQIEGERTMLAYHPHGMICLGFSWNGVHAPERELRGRFTWLVVDVLLRLPFFGLVCRWCANIRGASRESMTALMERGRNVALLPGGFEEATICARGADRVWVRSRKGFVKFALRYGYRVHPVYSFGEADGYSCLTLATRLRLWLCRFKVPAVAFFGWAPCPIFPRPSAEVVTVVGRALVFPTIANPSAGELDEWHARYVTALEDLFDRHKGPCAGRGPEHKLELW